MALCRLFLQGRCWQAACPNLHERQHDVECWYSQHFQNRGELCWRHDCPFHHGAGTRDPELPTLTVSTMTRGRDCARRTKGARAIAWHQQAVALAKHGVKMVEATVAQQRRFIRQQLGQRRRAGRLGLALRFPTRHRCVALAAARRLLQVARDIQCREEADLARAREEWPDLGESDIEGTMTSPVCEEEGSDVERDAVDSEDVESDAE